MAFSAPSLKGRALRLLSQREHSRAELERKLKKYEEEPGTLAAALDELAARDFISEARVVQSVLNQRAGRLGAARVRQELQAKGIDAEAVTAAVAGLQPTEVTRAHALWLRRFDGPAADSRERARQSRFLMARGFSGATVAKVLRMATAPDDEPADEPADQPADEAADPTESTTATQTMPGDELADQRVKNRVDSKFISQIGPEPTSRLRMALSKQE